MYAIASKRRLHRSFALCGDLLLIVERAEAQQGHHEDHQDEETQEGGAERVDGPKDESEHENAHASSCQQWKG